MRKGLEKCKGWYDNWVICIILLIHILNYKADEWPTTSVHRKNKVTVTRKISSYIGTITIFQHG
jgi:hypothetical protein